MKNKTLSIIGLVSFLLFLALLVAINAFEIVDKMDILINSKIQELRNPGFVQAMSFFTHIADGLNLTLLFVALFLSLVYVDWKKDHVINKDFYSGFFSMIILGLLLRSAFKYLVGRERPFGGLIETYESSFPSGHAVMATVFFLMIIYFYHDKINNYALQKIFVLICVLMIVLIGFSRVYLGVHWFTDVIGGILLGITSICIGSEGIIMARYFSTKSK